MPSSLVFGVWYGYYIPSFLDRPDGIMSVSVQYARAMYRTCEELCALATA